MKKSLKKAKGKAKKDNKNLKSLNKEEVQNVSGGADNNMPTGPKAPK